MPCSLDLWTSVTVGASGVGVGELAIAGELELPCMEPSHFCIGLGNPWPLG